MTEFSETSIEALAIIKKHKKGGISITELAKLLGVAKSNLGTRHLRPLKDAGLITENFKIGKDFYVKKIKKPKKTTKEIIEELKKKPPFPPEKSDIKKAAEELREKEIKQYMDIYKISRKEAEEELAIAGLGKGAPGIEVGKKEKKELTKPERRAKIKEAKEGLVSKKHAEWIKKSQFQHIPIGWFQYRPAQAAQFLRFLINIGISGAERSKISKTYGGMSSYRATMNQLISFLEQR